MTYRLKLLFLKGDENHPSQAEMGGGIN